MTFPSFARQSVQRLRPVETNDHGNTVRTYPDSGPVVGGLVIDPLSTREDNFNRTATITQYRVMAPPTADLQDEDHLLYRGKVYQILGEVQYQPSPTGALDQLVFVMEVWNG